MSAKNHFDAALDFAAQLADAAEAFQMAANERESLRGRGLAGEELDAREVDKTDDAYLAAFAELGRLVAMFRVTYANAANLLGEDITVQTMRALWLVLREAGTADGVFIGDADAMGVDWTRATLSCDVDAKRHGRVFRAMLVQDDGTRAVAPAPGHKPRRPLVVMTRSIPAARDWANDNAERLAVMGYAPPRLVTDPDDLRGLDGFDFVIVCTNDEDRLRFDHAARFRKNVRRLLSWSLMPDPAFTSIGDGA